jgi:hypothetical protein
MKTTAEVSQQLLKFQFSAMVLYYPPKGVAEESHTRTGRTVDKRFSMLPIMVRRARGHHGGMDRFTSPQRMSLTNAGRVQRLLCVFKR